MYIPIEDYAVIGDCHSAALISRRGSLDWLCQPRFDSPSVFAALLDSNVGGRFVVRPVGEYRAERRYIPGTAVLETIFTTASGAVRLLDAMPVSGKEERRRMLQPAHEVLRSIECVKGDVEVEIICDPRPDYGRVVPRLRHRGALGLYFERAAQLLALRSDIPLELTGDRSDAVGRVRLDRGDRRFVSLSITQGEPAVVAALGDAAVVRLDDTVRWWKNWSSRCSYDGGYRDTVIRSAITLKLMTFAPSGAVVAAPTTSLPEEPGGVRNWDYRYCWLRDASLTLQALFDLGYSEEAESFISWLLHATRRRRLQPQVVYNVYGEHRLKELELNHLEGYNGSRPVRVGNGAAGQFQLDNYGEVADAVHEFVSRGGRLDRQTARLLVEFGKSACRRWREPDEGIWEIRGRPRHHTYSKAMCWVALDRLIRLHDGGHLKAPVDQFRAERNAIRAEVEERGYNKTLGSYTDVFDGDDVDASLLLLARYGYADPKSERMLSTFDVVRERLGGNGLYRRYTSQHDGLPPGEGAFGICSFWAAETRARQGRVEEAREIFEYLLTYSNDVGLFGEEIDVETGAVLGNFPQAFTHLGLIDAALMIAQQMGSPGLRAEEKRKEATRIRV